MKKKIVMPGGSGFLGSSLAAFLKRNGYEVVILSRKSGKSYDGTRFVAWDGKNKGDWWDEVDGCEAIVNFTGKSVNCLYTDENRKEIINSRIHSVRAISEAILNIKEPPKVVIQSGSLAVFGDTKDLCDENTVHGSGFSVEVCEKWESEFFNVKLPRTRQVMLRIGFVLGRNGGALEPLQKLVRFFLGGTVGNGNQYISWLHIDDMNEMFKLCIENPAISGLYNATGPAAVTNRVFMKALRKSMSKPWSPPAPTPFVKLGAYLFMRADSSLALTGRNCVPKRFLDLGYKFKHTDLDLALRGLV